MNDTKKIKQMTAEEMFMKPFSKDKVPDEIVIHGSSAIVLMNEFSAHIAIGFAVWMKKYWWTGTGFVLMAKPEMEQTEKSAKEIYEEYLKA